LRSANAGDTVLAAEQVFFAPVSIDRTAKNDKDAGPDPRTKYGDVPLRFLVTFGRVALPLFHTGMRIRCWRTAAVKSDSL
jgi:hypothetical protein